MGHDDATSLSTIFAQGWKKTTKSVVEYVAHVLLEHHVHLLEAGQCAQWGECEKSKGKHLHSLINHVFVEANFER